MADLMAGIIPTSFVTNGLNTPPVSQLETEVFPICQMRDRDGAIIARNYTLCHNADAVIVRGSDEHLVRLALQYGLPVYQL